MTKPVSVGVAAAVLAVGWFVAPARSQSGLPLQFPPPASLRASTGSYTIRWEDIPPGGIDPGLYSLTWYYATGKDGSDRRRMGTAFHDDFSAGFRANWSPDGPFVFDWALRSDPGRPGRTYLTGPATGCADSQVAAPTDSVISVLARPDGIRGQVGIGVRKQARERCYTLVCTGDALKLMRGGEELQKQPIRPPLRLRDWYWFEIGMLNRKQKDVVIRIRVFDEKRERLIAAMDRDDKCPDLSLFKKGLISLCGPAQFAEVYIDPWEARWADDETNEFKWNTADVKPGKYYLFAEVADSARRARPVLVCSPFQVQVGRGSEARNE